MLNQRFIVFEGLDGAGKSTLLKLLQKELERAHQKVVVTREPGGTSLNEEIRHLILRKNIEAPTPRTELLLYEAARAQHVDRLIEPALQEGKWVLCDRFRASSVAFQAGGREISVDEVEWLNDFATKGCHPVLTVLLDLPYDEAVRRQQKRFDAQNEEADRMESEGRAFHERVRESFLSQARAAPEFWVVLSALQSPESLIKRLLDVLKERQLWEFSNPL